MALYRFDSAQSEQAYQYNQQFFSSDSLGYASGEVLAKIPYALDEISKTEISKQQLSALEPDGSWANYRAYPLKANSAGLHAYLLMPSDSTRQEVKVVFRGTADMASIIRDFDVDGPGSITMAQEQAVLIQQLKNRIVENFGSKAEHLHVTIAGHSLGASDAENFSAYLCADIAREGKASPFSALSLYSFNSPGVSHVVAAQSNQDAEAILKQRPHFKFKAHFGKSEHDVVQQLGESHIFHKIDPKLAEVDVLEVKKSNQSSSLADSSNFELSTKFAYQLMLDLINRSVHAHKLNTFFTPDQAGKLTNNLQRYKFISNQNAEDRAEVDQELSDKARNVLGMYKLLIDLLIQAKAWCNAAVFGKRQLATLSSLTAQEIKAGKRPVLTSTFMRLYHHQNIVPPCMHDHETDKKFVSPTHKRIKV